MNKRQLNFLGAAGFFASVASASPASADIFHGIERYLVGPEASELAEEISDLREAIAEETSANGRLSDSIGRCPASDQPLPAETFLLLGSDEPEARVQFLHEYGVHIGLGEAFDPTNRYHAVVAFARTHPNNPIYSRGDLTEDQLDLAAERMLEMTHTANQELADFWPPELGNLTQTDLSAIFTDPNLAELRDAISETLVERAELVRDMLIDWSNVCDTTPADDRAAARRSDSYFNLGRGGPAPR